MERLNRSRRKGWQQFDGSQTVSMQGDGRKRECGWLLEIAQSVECGSTSQTWTTEHAGTAQSLAPEGHCGLYLNSAACSLFIINLHHSLTTRISCAVQSCVTISVIVLHFYSVRGPA